MEKFNPDPDSKEPTRRKALKNLAALAGVTASGAGLYILNEKTKHRDGDIGKIYFEDSEPIDKEKELELRKLFLTFKKFINMPDVNVYPQKGILDEGSTTSYNSLTKTLHLQKAYREFISADEYVKELIDPGNEDGVKKIDITGTDILEVVHEMSHTIPLVQLDQNKEESDEDKKEMSRLVRVGLNNLNVNWLGIIGFNQELADLYPNLSIRRPDGNYSPLMQMFNESFYENQHPSNGHAIENPKELFASSVAILSQKYPEFKRKYDKLKNQLRSENSHKGITLEKIVTIHIYDIIELFRKLYILKNGEGELNNLDITLKHLFPHFDDIVKDFLRPVKEYFINDNLMLSHRADEGKRNDHNRYRSSVHLRALSLDKGDKKSLNDIMGFGGSIYGDLNNELGFHKKQKK
jgi:hypothetical protein